MRSPSRRVRAAADLPPGGTSMTTWKTPASALAMLAALVLSPAPARAAGRTIMVVGPHEDDESLLGAGRTREAVLAGDTVVVVLVTNGDVNGTAEGLLREGESVAAAQILGVPEPQVVFLGYGDQSLYDLFTATATPAKVFTSLAGMTATYGNRGLGGMDFHRYRTGVAGPYNRETALSDFKALITTFRPDEIYTTSYLDNHGDHDSTARFLTEALLTLKREGQAVPARLFESVIWAPYANGGCYGDWPPAGSGPLPYAPFPAPQCVGPGTTLDWNMALHFPAPPEMQEADPAVNLKWRALAAYSSQFGDFLASFVRKDEFFWRFDLADNLSGIATVTASSDYPEAYGQKEKAVDMFADVEHEWKSLDDTGAWIQLDWAAPVRIGQINLYDRIDPNDNVLAGTLSFSDGSSVAVGALPTIGKPLQVLVAPRTVTWVRFTLDQVTGSTPGLAEIEVLGVPATSTENVPPHFLQGIVASPAAIESDQVSTLTALGHDLDGDPVGYAWSADGGTIAGSGASAVFTPPAVAQKTIFTVTVQLSDGRGGGARTSQFVTVSPAVPRGIALALAPASVPAGLPATGTVLLSAAAPGGGVTVSLASDTPEVAAVPASVTVPAGATSATFAVATRTVAAATPVVVTASLGTGTATAALDVTPPIPVGLALTPASAVGGSAVQATATLSAAAPAGGIDLAVTTTDPALAWAPPAATVAGGALAADFVVSTAPVASARVVTVAVSDGTSTASGALTLQPLQVAGLSLVPSAVSGGASSTGTVTLNGPAGPAGASVALASADPATVAVPGAVVVAPGATSATFAALTVPVASATPVAITATFGGGTAGATLTVDPVVLAGLAIAPVSVVAGGAATGSLTLSGPAPSAGFAVALSSSKPAVASVPASAIVPAGAGGVSFPVSTSPVTSTTSVTLTATANGLTRSATISVTPLTVKSIALAPSSVLGGASSTGTVTLSATAPAGGAIVALWSNNVAVAVPATVGVPEGATSATFTAVTTPVSAQTAVSISASRGNTRSATLTVKPPALSTLKLAQASVVGGTPATAQIALNGPAPAAGFSVTVTSSNAAASVPAVVVVPAGSAGATLAVVTSAVTAVTTSAIAASAGTVKRSATLTMTPSTAVLAIALAPASIASMGTSQATVTLNGPAPAGGTAVAMKSSRPAAATVPASLLVPEGSSSGTVTVTAGAVTASTTTSISATAGRVTRSAVLTVTP